MIVHYQILNKIVNDLINFNYVIQKPKMLFYLIQHCLSIFDNHNNLIIYYHFLQNDHYSINFSFIAIFLNSTYNNQISIIMNERNSFQQSQFQQQNTQTQTKMFNNSQNTSKWYLKIQTYQIQTQVLYIFLQNFIQFLFIAATTATYFLIDNNNTLFNFNWQSLSTTIDQQILIIIITVSLAIKILIVFVLGVNIIFDQSMGLIQFIRSVTGIIKQKMRYIIELQFQISGCLLLTSNILTLPNFIFSIAIAIFSVIFLQNYSFYKDIFHCKSMMYLIVVRCTMILGYIGNWICLTLQNKSLNIKCFIGIHVHLAIFSCIIYFIIGYYTYKNQKLRWLLINYIVFYLSVSLNLLFIYLNITNELTLESALVDLCITHLIIFMLYYAQLSTWKITFINGKLNHIQQEQYFLSILLEDSHFNVDQRGIISGLLRLHNIQTCQNLNCYVKNANIYDSKKRKQFGINETVIQRISLLKFYIKCRYQYFIQQNPQDIDIKMQFMEFIFLKFRNVSLSLYWINKIDKQSLGLVQKLKLFRFIGVLMNENQTLSDQLYNQKLDMQHLINCEETHQKINCQILQLLEVKLETVNYLQNQKIDISILRKMIEFFSIKSKSILQSWKYLSKYIQNNRKWKFQYLCFLFYIRNEKLKSKATAQFQNKDSINFKEQHINQQFDGLARHLNCQMLFSNQICSIHTIFKEQSLFVKNVSKNFTKITGYSFDQVKLAELNIFLPSTISQYHNAIVKEWAHSGRSCNEQEYRISKVGVVDNKQYLLSCDKFIKQMVSMQGQIQYICLLRKGIKKKYSLICNQLFEIENVSKDIIDLLEIDEEEGRYFKHINLLSMLPCLFQQKWSKELELVKDETSLDLAELMSINLSTFDQNKQKQRDDNTIFEFKSTKNHKIVDQGQKMVQFYYCHNVSTCAEYFNSAKKQMDQKNILKYVQAIQDTHNLIRFDKKSFECKVILQKIQISNSFYYLVQLEKIQSHNSVKTDQQIQTQEDNTQLYKKTSEFQEHFKNKGIVGLNLSPTSNLFIKEDHDLPPKTNYFLSLLSLALKILFLGITSVGLSKMIIMNSNYNSIRTKGLLVNNTIFMFKIPFVLANYYFIDVLNLADNNSYVNDRIRGLTDSIQSIFNSKQMRNVIYDQQFNIPKSYWPVSNVTGSIGYNQIDLIYLMESNMRTIATYSKINPQASEFILFNNYLYPALNNLINSTKISLHKSFQVQFLALNNAQTLVYSLQSVAFFLAISIIIFLSNKFYASMFAVIDLHCHFSEAEMFPVKKYLQQLQCLFTSMKPQIEAVAKIDEKTLSGITQIKKYFISHITSSGFTSKKSKQNQNANLNKKTKNIEIGKQTKQQRRAYYIKIVIGFLLLLALTMSNNIYLQTLIAPIIQLQTDGYAMMKNYPTGSIAGYIVTQKHYSTVFGNKFNSTYLNPIFSNMLTSKNKAYIGKPYSELQFYVKSKQYYYGNVCQNFKDILIRNNIDLQMCNTIANNSFIRGVTSYLGFQYNKVNKIMKLNQSLTLAQTKQFMTSLQVLNVINDHFLKIYTQTFIDLADLCILKVNIFTGMTIALGLLLVILFQRVLLSALRKQYNFYCEFYIGMMPEWIVREEKIIKSKLNVARFLTE